MKRQRHFECVSTYDLWWMLGKERLGPVIPCWMVWWGYLEGPKKNELSRLPILLFPWNQVVKNFKSDGISGLSVQMQSSKTRFYTFQLDPHRQTNGRTDKTVSLTHAPYKMHKMNRLNLKHKIHKNKWQICDIHFFIFF